MRVFKKLITCLFNKYCFDDWVVEQQYEEEQKLMKKYKCKDAEELNTILLDLQQEPYRKAFDEGAQYGYEKGLEQR